MAMAFTPTSSIFSNAQHHLGKEHRHFTFDASIPPAISVSPGERILLETNDCFNGLVTPENADIEVHRENLNPVTGPIFVKGAMPGDFLSIKFHDIQPVGKGVARCGSSSGQLSHFMNNKKSATRFFDISTNHDRSVVTMSEDHVCQRDCTNRRIAPISFPLSPMLGVVGLAPEGNKAISTMPAGKHGGNLDNKLNGIGSVIHIPINHPGGLLSIGDMHASQGDGEICGTGVEVAGHVLLSCEIVPKASVAGTFKYEYPITETATHWITHGVAVEDIPKATTIACEEAAKLLMGEWGFTAEEAYIFLSVQGNLGLCQACHPDVGTQIAKMIIPKIDACPKPFKMMI